MHIYRNFANKIVSVKRVISVAMVGVGTMIGAGYASGQEIAAFFGWSPSLFVPIFCGVLIFSFSCVLLLVGRRLHTDNISAVNAAMFGRARSAVDGVMVFNALIVLSAMLAGMDGTVREVTGFAFPYGVFSGMIALLVLRRGNRGLHVANVIIVPFIMLIITVTCIRSPLTAGEFDISSVPKCFSYVSMNLLLSASVFVRQSGMSIKQILASSALGAVLIASAMSLICCALPNAPSNVLPMLSLARTTNLNYVAFALCLAVSIFTTMLSALSTLQSWAAAKGDGVIGMLVGLLIASAISVFGFRAVVDFCYPVIGVIGLIYILRCTVFLLPARFVRLLVPNNLIGKRRKRVHSAGKNTKRNRRRHNEVGFEHLPAVNDKIAEPRARNEVLAHDRTDPGKPDVNFDNGHKRWKSGGKNGVTELLQPTCAHGTEK